MNIIEVIHQLAHIWGHRGKLSRMDLEVGEFLGVELVDHFFDMFTLDHLKVGCGMKCIFSSEMRCQFLV